jgi:hypothetical protein
MIILYCIYIYSETFITPDNTTTTNNNANNNDTSNNNEGNEMNTLESEIKSAIAFIFCKLICLVNPKNRDVCISTLYYLYMFTVILTKLTTIIVTIF